MNTEVKYQRLAAEKRPTSSSSASKTKQGGTMQVVASTTDARLRDVATTMGCALHAHATARS